MDKKGEIKIIKITNGMEQDFEIIETNAPEKAIKFQLIHNNELLEARQPISNPYNIIEKLGYFVKTIGDSDSLSDSDVKALEIAQEYDCYDCEFVGWQMSSYNENTQDQLDFYMSENECELGDTAFLYSHEDNTLSVMEIANIIVRSNDTEYYDNLSEYVLVHSEGKYNADRSAEFITDNDCYLVWLRYCDQI